MKLIIGLGNPEEEYKNTRHNVGFLVVDELLKKTTSHKSQITNKPKIQIFKSQNFMNDSGSFVLSQYTKYHILNTDLYIVHDDLDIPLGSYKIQFGKGPKDHNGLVSIDQALGTREYWHVRVGIENRDRDMRVSGEDYVLQDFTDQERGMLDNTFKKLLIDLIALISK